MRASAELAVPDDSKSVREGAIKAWRVGAKSIIIAHNRILRQLSEQIPFDPNVPWKDLPERTRKILLYGDDSRTYSLRLRRGNCRPADVYFKGILAEIDRLCAETSSDALRARLAVFQISSVCPSCGGARFSARTRNVFVEGVSYDKFCSMSVSECLAFVGHVVADSQTIGQRARLGNEAWLVAARVKLPGQVPYAHRDAGYFKTCVL